jgi:predicted nucleic acid-binding protein
VIFVDTGFFFAFFSAKDPDHDRAREVFESFKGQHLPSLLLTTDQVVSETITLCRKRMGHEEAVFAGQHLYSERMAQIHRASFEEQLAAFRYFTRYSDKDYSMVDCLSFVVMEKLGIHEALAVDEDFTHRFIARPGPRPRT